MSLETYYSVEQISKLLNIHPKTIQRYIREGKLRAGKIGKSWRVTGHDLSVFMENDKSVDGPIEDRIKVSSVVDVRDMDQEGSVRMVDALTAALNSKPFEYGSSSMHTQYVKEENMLRISLWGGIRFMEVMIGSISAWMDRSEGGDPR